VDHASDKRNSDRYDLTSWALAFYLTFERRLLGTPELDQYVVAGKRGVNPLDAFALFAGQPLASLEKSLQQYLLGLRSDGSFQAGKETSP